MACNIFLDLPNGAKMPALGYGTWQSSDEESLEKALDVALEIGYRHIDTAQAYQNEHVIGRVLKRWFDSGKLKREDIFLTTKQAPSTMFPDRIEENLKQSLKNLQLDYVDLYLIHFPITMVPGEDGKITGITTSSYLDIWKKMEEQYDTGRVKAIGISNFNQKQVEDVLKNSRVKPANLQIELHVYMQQRDLVDYCKKNGVTVVAYSPLGSRGYNQFLEKMGLGVRDLPDLFANPVVEKIGKKHAKTPAQVLLRYLLQVGVAPIPKSVTPLRVKENFDVFDFALSQDDMKALDDLEVGTSVRICDFQAFGSGIRQHPNFPF